MTAWVIEMDQLGFCGEDWNDTEFGVCVITVIVGRLLNFCKPNEDTYDKRLLMRANKQTDMCEALNGVCGRST